jgi:hypothetical protein
MNVLIEGIRYVPQPELPAGQSLLAALEVRFDSNAGTGLSVRDYLWRLLSDVWEDKDLFSGKRPFGNSGWESDLYKPLAQAGFIDATVQDHVVRMTPEQSRLAHAYVKQLIGAALYGVPNA